MDLQGQVIGSKGLGSIREGTPVICDSVTVTFGGSGALRQVVCLEVEPVRGTYVVPEISEISNCDRPGIVKREYAHLKDLWLSDVCKEKGLLEIDMLIGADYLWAFQSGKVVKGKVGEPGWLRLVWVGSCPVQ